MRRATKDDIPRLVELGRAMHAESRFRAFSFNTDKVARGFERMLGNANFILLVDGDPVHAMFLGGAHEFWWGDDLESSDVVLYVTPEKRGGSSALKLVRGYIAWAKRKDVADIRIATATGVNTERTLRFFERVGFAQMSYGLAIPNELVLH